MEVFKEQSALLYSIPLIAAAMLLEWAMARRRGFAAYTLQETLTNGYMAMIFGTLDFVLRTSAVLPILYFFAELSPFDWTRGPVYWVSVFVLTDLAYYGVHWVDHRCRVFWAVHVTHHTSVDFNISTGFRSPVFQSVYRVLYFVPIAFLGFDPLDILLVYALAQIYGTLIHTRFVKSMGWLDYVLVTPAYHRVHHASNPEYLDKNLGMFLIVWDRLFGTFQPELPHVVTRFGITRDVSDRGPVNIVFHEWIDLARDLRHADASLKFQYLVRPPGWSPR